MIAKSDGTVHTNLYKKFGVEGYPTIKWLQDDKAYTYSGERNAAKLKEFVEVWCCCYVAAKFALVCVRVFVCVCLRVYVCVCVCVCARAFVVLL